MGLGLKVRVAENVLSARKAQYWIRASACRHSLWPQENWPTCQSQSAPLTPSAVAHSTKFGKVSRELLIINNFEVFNELERGFLGG